MFSKRNPMKYFSGNAFARLPLYKLVAGGSAVVLTASIGLGVMAASFTPQAQPEPTPEPTAIVEATPTPTPEPTATPEPDKDLYVDVTVVQQDIGVELYTLPTTTPESASDKDVAAQFLPMLKQRLVDDRTAAGLTPVELHLDARAAAIIDGVPAAPADFDTEYLDYKLSVAVVNTLDDAIAHIAKHSTHHSEAIITADKAAAQRFTACVDSAAVYVHASTRFTDGGEFGLDCEMGISTQKLHARGPMGLAELCTYKYIIHGSGQTRGGAAAKLQTPCC